MCLVCTSGDTMKHGYLAAEGFGSQLCHLEPEPRNQVTGVTIRLEFLSAAHYPHYNSMLVGVHP